jgi:hypothetical protein
VAIEALLNQNGLPGRPKTCSPDLPVLHPLTAANAKHNNPIKDNDFMLMNLKNLVVNYTSINDLRIFLKFTFHFKCIIDVVVTLSRDLAFKPFKTPLWQCLTTTYPC